LSAERPRLLLLLLLQAKGKNRQRTKSEPQGETGGESSEKKHINDSKPESRYVANSDLN
jgi:hypothetical protein